LGACVFHAGTKVIEARGKRQEARVKEPLTPS
jgi:hypothetical protein